MANLGAPAGTGRRWVVLGDSMARGVGAPSFDRGLVGQLARRLAADGDELEVVNLSATGACVPDLLGQQLPVLDAWPAPRLPGIGPGHSVRLHGKPVHHDAFALHCDA